MIQRALAAGWRILAWLRRSVRWRPRTRSATAGLSSDDAKIATPVEEAFDCLIPSIQQYQLAASEYADARMQLYKLVLDVASRGQSRDREVLREEVNRIVMRENELLINLRREVLGVHGEIDRLRSTVRELDAAEQARRRGLVRISGCDDPARTGDVVFVHGLDGDAISTWRCNADDPNSFWPDWLGRALPAVGVWSLGYDATAIRFESVNMELKERAVGALNTLNNERFGDHRLVFICHSMGGLLVKEMLRRASNENIPSEWKKIKKSTAGVLFLATPHHGSDIASVLHAIVSRVGLPCDIAELRAHNPYLHELNDWFRENIRPKRTRLMSCFETRLIGPCVIVDKASTDLQVPGVPPVPIDDVDHVTICKPQSETAIVYMTAKRFVEAALHL